MLTAILSLELGIAFHAESVEGNIGSRASLPQRAARRAGVFFQVVEIFFALRAHCGRDARDPVKKIKKRAGVVELTPALCFSPTTYN